MSLLATLAGIVGPAHCLSGADRGPYVVEGRTPAAVVFPGTVDEVGRVVRAAAEAGAPIIPWGGGTQMTLGAPPPDGAVVVVTRRLDRVVEHEPGDLTATVEAGATVAALQAALGARGQWVSLDPPFPERATLGGVLATNAAGPRRFLYGTARDLVIGMRVVGADGQVIRSGGKVVKNVAGYDLHKLYIGSLGTLGLIVEATLKLRPRPEAEGGCWAVFETLAGAAGAVRTVMRADLLPHSLEVLDGPGGRRAAEAAGLPAPRPGGGALLVGFDGLPRTVAAQLDEARQVLGAAGAAAVEVLDRLRAEAALAFVRDFRAAVAEPLAVSRVVVLPADVGAYAAEAAQVARAAGLTLLTAAHAGTGVLRCLLAPSEGASPGVGVAVKVLRQLRELAHARGGFLLVEWAPLPVKEEVPVWDDPGPAGRVMARIRARLDPRNVMNPGRFVLGL